MGLNTYYFIEYFKRDHGQNGGDAVRERHLTGDLFLGLLFLWFPLDDLQNGVHILREGGGDLCRVTFA